MTDTVITDDGKPAELRNAMTNTLITDGYIDSPEVEAAFRKVPREAFAPGDFLLNTVYDTREVLRGRRDATGTVLSSVSAPWMQARMIAQAGIQPGMSVLEIGSGGYNAALLAEITGTTGRVVSVDIDPDVTARATTAMNATGYAGQVEVVTADAGAHVPAGPYDAIIVTAGAWDIAPAWLDALPEDGTLVVPLRMNGVTRSIGFRRSGEHLTSTSAQTCGFVPVQGTTAYAERSFVLPMPAGGQALLRFEDNAPDRIPVASDILQGEPAEAWSSVTTANMVSFADLFLWCSGFLPAYCRISTGDDTLPGGRRRPDGPGRYPCACVHEDSLAYLASRRTSDNGISEFGARAHGPNAAAAAELLVDHIRQWNAHGRDLPATAFAYWPTGTYQGPPLGKIAVFRKTRGSVAATWPPAQAVPHRNDSGTVTSASD